LTRHPYADFLGQVEKPSRYVGGEYQEVRKDPARVEARICLAFPDVYEIGMSHLGTKILYGVLNKTEGLACERVFSPWVDCEAQLRARGLPIVTLESATPVGEFDVVGFSLQYELTYTNVLALLDLAGLPLRAADRGDREPLVIAGGPTATHPEPLAPFIDAFFIGEAEEQLPPLVREGRGAPARRRAAARAPDPTGRKVSTLRSRALRHRARAGDRPPGGGRADRSARAGAAEARLGSRHQPLSISR
jgi:radical SAM superfamily enzyme YgiQ (UPF0313 family)